MIKKYPPAVFSAGEALKNFTAIRRKTPVVFVTNAEKTEHKRAKTLKFARFGRALRNCRLKREKSRAFSG